MFSLAIYDTLTPGSLTGGKSVAGTGEIASDGTVGPIGGIQQKIVGARDAGAELFLVPAANCESAEGARNGDMRLVKVKTMHSALTSIQKWVEDPDAELPTCGGTRERARADSSRRRPGAGRRRAGDRVAPRRGGLGPAEPALRAGADPRAGPPRAGTWPPRWASTPTSAAGSLTPVEQDSLPAGRRLEETLDAIVWPAEVAGCAAVVERLVLPPGADDQAPEDPGSGRGVRPRAPRRPRGPDRRRCDARRGDVLCLAAARARRPALGGGRPGPGAGAGRPAAGHA